jgi:hypothetical protein
MKPVKPVREHMMKDHNARRKTCLCPSSRSLDTLLSTHLLVQTSTRPFSDHEAPVFVDNPLARRSWVKVAEIILTAIARKFNIWYQHSHS